MFRVLRAVLIKRWWWEQLGAPMVWSGFKKPKFLKTRDELHTKNWCSITSLAVHNRDRAVFWFWGFSSKKVSTWIFLLKKESVLYFCLLPRPLQSSSVIISTDCPPAYYSSATGGPPHCQAQFPWIYFSSGTQLLHFPRLPTLTWPTDSFSISPLGLLAALCPLQPVSRPNFWGQTWEKAVAVSMAEGDIYHRLISTEKKRRCNRLFSFPPEYVCFPQQPMLFSRAQDNVWYQLPNKSVCSTHQQCRVLTQD